MSEKTNLCKGSGIQIAVNLPISVCDNAYFGAILDFVKSLGADQVIDYTTTKFEDVAKEVDLVVGRILQSANAM